MMLEQTKKDNYPDIRFYFNPEPDLLARGTKDGQIDLKDLSSIQRITKDTVLLEKVPLVGGDPLELETEAKKLAVTQDHSPECKNTDEFILGRNVKWDGNYIKATAEGIPVLNGREVEVRMVYEVKGDVNRKTGNINFDGDIIIKGDVIRGSSVQATGNIFVFGEVDEGVLSAEGDIVVNNGIIGGGKSRITCRSIYAGYINNANIKSSQDVIVRDAILNSQVEAGHNVSVTGEKGAIYGGKVKAGLLIDALFLGSKVGTATELEVGSQPDFQWEMERLEDSLGEIETDLSVFKASLESINQQSEKLIPEQLRNKAALTAKIQRYKRVQQSLIKEKNELQFNKEQYKIETGYIKVDQGIHPGVKIKIGKMVSLFKHQVSNGVLVSSNKGEIVFWEKGSLRLKHNR